MFLVISFPTYCVSPFRAGQQISLILDHQALCQGPAQSPGPMLIFWVDHVDNFFWGRGSWPNPLSQSHFYFCFALLVLSLCLTHRLVVTNQLAERLWSQGAWVQILALPLHMWLEKWFNFPRPHLPHLQNRENNTLSFIMTSFIWRNN